MVFNLQLGIIEISAMIGAGFYLLAVAADWLVTGASGLAARFGISALVIGLTVVAFGTSMPEFVVSVDASLAGNPGIAVGNVVGSNIFNIALILGIAALIKPVVCDRSVIKRDVPIMIFVTGLMWFFSSDLLISRPEAGIMFLLLIIYILFSYLSGKKEAVSDDGTEQEADEVAGVGHNFGLIAIGLVAMIGGSKLLLNGSVAVAKVMGVSDEVIGLTLIAAGTSLPELATSVVAALKGKSDIAVGNVVGSNIFNLLGILGLAGMILPLKVSEHMKNIDCPIMMVITLGCLPLMISGMKITRLEGIVLIAAYLGYTWVLFQTPV